ncbi:hypothetical protein IV102_09490 [bacterium]|nr:hypothetical protein [bacterium]
MKKNFDVLFAQRVAEYRNGEIDFDDFADWCEATIEEKRVRAFDLVVTCQTEIYLSFASRAGKKEHEAVASMEEGFELILAFINNGGDDDTLLDEAIPYLQEAVRLILEAIELNEECLELDGGVAGTI